MSEVPLTFLVTGVLRPSSIATHVVKEALSQGHRVIATTHPTTRALATVSLRGLANPDGTDLPLLDLDVTSPESLSTFSARLTDAGFHHLDGLLHSMAYASADMLSNVTSSSMKIDAVHRSFDISVASLPRLIHALDAFLPGGSLNDSQDSSLSSLSGAGHEDVNTRWPCGVVTLVFDTAHVWPGYGWMGVMKSALEAMVRTLAVEQANRNVRVNAISSGPLPTPASSAIPTFSSFMASSEQAPLSWDSTSVADVARMCVMLMSSAMPAMTGHVVECDGGLSLLPPLSTTT
ncbi:enoyl-ACP reductase FabI [Actinomyces vulturis]|uniref:enoyl-ACP reductase FabI n=1 Tax=Actinomyces vulturis TaxID=1857645 RepID=UPI00082ECB8B|nr:SDR family oxidoreductase [Actinomyces vulturis]